MHRLEFYPHVVFTIPESAGGSCCMKPVPKQTRSSEALYLMAKRLRHQFAPHLELIIPSACQSRIRPYVKWVKFKARLRLARLKVDKLPALVFDDTVLCIGELTNPEELQAKVEMLITAEK